MSTVVGSFDKYVGVCYDFTNSKKQDRDLWFTNEDFTYYIGDVAEQRYVTVPKGYVTDGASVPRLFWGMIPPWGSYGQAAVVHDFLCEKKQLTFNNNNPLTLDQAQIDRVLWTAMRASGVPYWKSALIYGAVRAWHMLGL